MKIGILTHYNVYNLGAQLQMLALEAYLRDLGHTVRILTYEKNFDFRRAEKDRNSGSWRSVPFYLKHYLFEKGPGLTWFNYRKVKAINRSIALHDLAPYDQSGCDAIVIGSDEVFSLDVGCNRMMYGYGLGDTPAIAYAPAFGRTTEDRLKQYHCYELVRDGLTKMFSVSARDKHTQEMIRSLTGREAPLVCDPVLLYDHKWCDRNIVCGPLEWYSYFKNAACVVTDTFHGAVVSIKNHCNVAVFIRQSLNAFKLESLLEVTGLKDRRLAAVSESELERVLSAPTDAQATDKRIAALAEESGGYLKEALERVEHGEYHKAY